MEQFLLSSIRLYLKKFSHTLPNHLLKLLIKTLVENHIHISILTQHISNNSLKLVIGPKFITMVQCQPQGQHYGAPRIMKYSLINKLFLLVYIRILFCYFYFF